MESAEDVWDETSYVDTYTSTSSYSRNEIGDLGYQCSSDPSDHSLHVTQSQSSTEYPTVSTGNEVNFYFTQEPSAHGWNNKHSPPIQECGDDEEALEFALGRSYADFENKLQKGFLEAPNLGLVAAPPAMFDYRPALQRIDLKDNKIEVLPEQFFDDLPMLCWCDLRYNRLQCLPLMNAKHEHLNVLLLQDNQLTSIPCSLALAVKLHTFGWTNNNIVDPPRHVLLRGCSATLAYLRMRLAQQIPIDEQGNLTSLKSDDKLKQDLVSTSQKSVANRSASRTSVGSTTSSMDLKNEELNEKRRIDRLKYTWALWQNIPYHGVSNQTLFEKSLKEVKNEVKSKLNRNKDAILQKVKDNDALGKWRWDTRMLQMKGPVNPYTGIALPFGSDADVQNDYMSAESTLCSHEMTNPEAFQSTMAECMRKLQEFTANPTPINDTEKSIQRLQEVEDIQRKLLNMKLTYSLKSSTLV